MTLLNRMIFLLALLMCLGFAHTGFAQEATVVRRAAMDIGSANIKCAVADVDIATGRVVEMIETMSMKVDFAEDLARSYDSNLTEEIMVAGIEALRKIKARALELKAVEFSAAGGAVFRAARNGRAYFVRIENETGIPCRVISKQQAAMLNFHAAKQAMHSSPRAVLVWDIGGGSQNMTARSFDGGLHFYLDNMASVTFKNVVIERIQKKTPATTTSPNPVSMEEVQVALTYIRGYAETTVPQLIATKLKNENMIVAGIGGVHYYSIPEVLGERNEFYTREEVAQALEEWTGKTDEDFDSKYAATRLTNLILVLGFMDALGINEIYPLKVNHSNGLLTAREFW